MAEEFLDVAQVGAVFQEVGGKGVAERVETEMLADGCLGQCAVKDRLGRADGQVFREFLSGKEPRVNHKVVSVLGVERLDTAGEYGVPVIISFS